MGVSYSEFKHLNPYKLSLIAKGYEMQRKARDEEIWMWIGVYCKEAIALGVKKGLWEKKVEYPKKPVLNMDTEEEENGYKESHEEVAVFEMKQRINLLRQSGLPESPD